MNIIKVTSNQMPFDEVEGILNLTTIHSISRFEVLSFVTLKLAEFTGAVVTKVPQLLQTRYSFEYGKRVL